MQVGYEEIMIFNPLYLFIWEMIQDRVYYGMSMQSIEWCYFSDLESPLTQISSTHDHLMLNISEKVQDRDIITMEYE